MEQGAGKRGESSCNMMRTGMKEQVLGIIKSGGHIRDVGDRYILFEICNHILAFLGGGKF
jgi:hypothetical protein